MSSSIKNWSKEENGTEKEKMYVKILRESGHDEALLGLSLSYNCTDKNRVRQISRELAIKDGGHNKFLESIIVWIDILAPRYWWQEFDTYRVGVTKQSESTMHTLMKTPISQAMFEREISQSTLFQLENLRKDGDISRLKNELPEGFLQRRIVCTNYKTLRNILSQREGHRLYEWRFFNEAIQKTITYPEYLKK